jgi:hypothetical protein
MLKGKSNENIILLILITLISCNEQTTALKNDSKEILLYFVNDKTITLRPGQITEAEFWGSPESLDTLKIQDSVREYMVRFNALKDTMLYSSDEVDLFPHVFAFVFETDKRIDTLYANRSLSLFVWKGKKKFYKDTTLVFHDRFYALTNVN